jgi:conjugative transfer signal peptidase TraF
VITCNFLARAAQTSICAAVATLAIGAAAGLRGIVSESMPRGLYYTEPFEGTLSRGDTIEVCLPKPVSKFARSRGYLAAGIFCDDGVQRIVKSVLAVPGDTVDVTPLGFRVAGKLVPNTAPLAHDSRGRPLPVVRPGRYPVRAGTVWLFSTETPASFDSRYFGPVPQSAIRRRFHPLWTERHRASTG